MGFVGHHPSFRVGKRPRLKGIRWRVMGKTFYVFLWPLLVYVPPYEPRHKHMDIQHRQEKERKELRHRA